MKIKTVKLYELSLLGDVKVSLTYPQLQALHSLTSELLGMGVVTNLPDAHDHVPHMTDRVEVKRVYVEEV